MTDDKKWTTEQILEGIEYNEDTKKIERTIDRKRAEIAATHLEMRTVGEWASIDEQTTLSRIAHGTEVAESQRWGRSDEQLAMWFAGRIAPTMPEAASDDIAKRAVQIVEAVRARFVQGEGS